MKKTTLTLLLLLLCAALFAQKPERKAEKKQKRSDRKEARLEKKEVRQQENNFLLMGLGGSANYTVDTRMAQNHYEGMGASFSLGNQHEKPKGFYDVQFAGFTYNSLSPAHGESATDNIRYDFSFGYLRNLRQLGENWRWRLGGCADFTYNSRTNNSLGNDAFAHDLIGSLGIASSLERDLHFFKRDWHFRATARLPLLAYVNRLPEYSLSGWGTPAGSLKPIGLFNQAKTAFSLFKPFHKYTPNGFQINYQWDFYGFNDSDIHQVRVGNHHLGMAILIKL